MQDLYIRVTLDLYYKGLDVGYEETRELTREEIAKAIGSGQWISLADDDFYSGDFYMEEGDNLYVINITATGLIWNKEDLNYWEATQYDLNKGCIRIPAPCCECCELEYDDMCMNSDIPF